MRRFAGVSVVAVIVALLGADVSAAQGGGGENKASISKSKHAKKKARALKKAKKFVRRKALLAVAGQPPVFPNAHITKTKPSYIGCVKVGGRRFSCIFSIVFYEWEKGVNTVAEPLQRSLRFCGTPDGDPSSTFLDVRGRGRKLRVVGPWKMSCDLSQLHIDLWNIFADHPGEEYQPDVTQSLPHNLINDPKKIAELPEPEDGLLPAPSGEPGPAPGPLSAIPGVLGRSSASASQVGGYPSYCTPNFYPYWVWVTYTTGTYAVYACFWDSQVIPFAISHGAGLGIFNTVTYYQAYYWTGYAWRLFQSGTTGPPAGMA